MTSNSGKVFITDYIDVPDIESDVLGENLASSLHEDIQVVLVWHEKIDKAFLDKLPNLRGVVRYGVGFDNIDLSETRKRGIWACNTPDYGTDEVSDTAMAMILNIVRGVSRYDYQCRSYRDSWQENTISTLRRTNEIKLGIIGAGRIGGSVAIKSRAFQFNCRIYDPYKPRGHEKMLQTGRADSLEELLSWADIVTFHAPLSERTKGIVDENFIACMKQGASFVNTARGGVISDVDIFYEPLKSGYIDSVALDVLPDEPPGNSPLLNAWREREQWLDGRLIINPHSAYYSSRAYFEMRHKAASNALRILESTTPFNIVNGLD